MIFLIIRAATRSARNEALQNPAIKSANCPVVSGWPAIIPWWAKLRGLEESFGHSEQKTNARFIAETGGHEELRKALRDPNKHCLGRESQTGSSSDSSAEGRHSLVYPA